jgi:hypothetical protein
VSISSLDEGFRLRASDEPFSEASRARYSFSLQQYGKAIQKITTDSSRVTGPVAVVASAIFCFLFEIWLGDMREAQKHALAAQKMLSTQPATCTGENDDIANTTLRTMVMRISSQFTDSEQLGEQLPVTDPIHEWYTPPATFQSYGEAKTSLDVVSRSVFAQARKYSKDDGEIVRRAIDALQDRLQSWHTALLDLDKRQRIGRSSVASLQRKIMEVRYLYFKITLGVLPFDDEILYDKYLDEFADIVNQCERILVYTADHNPGVHRSTESTPTTALTFTAVSCRDPNIRRRAIKLLYRFRRLEGVWSSLACGIMAEHILMIEEAGRSDVVSAADIPVARRVIPFSLQYDSGRTSGGGRWDLPTSIRAKTNETSDRNLS